eukprot:TRINITY_DN6538_c0_g1_i1.p1 TRINITY_DN6538_c0_g1~~TRINITY_DN6538_c0_g1_i1.p1  ORF type:complete len:866 (+),score=169.78 TRINITY_DN6538_c0_g1_i1:100-2697(+)
MEHSKEKGDLRKRVFQVEHTLTGHTDVVLEIVLNRSENLLFSASQDGTIRVWNLLTYECINVIQGHQRSIVGLYLFGDYLISASRDRKVKAWNTRDNFSCQILIGGNKHGICSAHLFSSTQKSLLFLGCQDTSIMCFDIEKLLQNSHSSSDNNVTTSNSGGTIIGYHNGYVYCFTSSPSHLFSGGGDGIIKIWELSSLEEKANLDTGKQAGAVLSLATDAHYLYSGFQDGVIFVFDLQTNYLVRTLNAHEKDVVSISTSTLELFSCSTDGYLKIWDKQNLNCKQFFERSNLQWNSCKENEAEKDQACLVMRIYPSEKVYCGYSDYSIKIFSAIKQQDLSLSDEQKIIDWDLATPTVQSRIPLDLSLIDTLRLFVSFRTVSSDPSLKNECWKGARFLHSLFVQYGFETKMVESKAGKNPIILSRLGRDSHKPTVCIYGHYDVVEAPSAGWNYPPFELTSVDGYLYGRGATDDKGPILAALYAMKELVDECEGELTDLPINLIFMVEGEEENGSEGFQDGISRNIDWFAHTDVLLISNTNWIGMNKPCLTYGLRGVVRMELEVEGPARDLHSGWHGGPIFEPMIDLVHTLSSLIDSYGTITIPGFYDKVARENNSETGASEQSMENADQNKSKEDGKEISKVDAEDQKYFNPENLEFDMKEYQNELNIQSFRKDYNYADFFKQRWKQPSLSVHHVGSAVSTGHTSSVIPNKAIGKISIRTVPNQDIEEIIQITTDHLHSVFEKLKSGNKLRVKVTNSGDWWLGDPSNRYFQVASKSIETVWGMKPSFIREGGSIPLTRLLSKMLNAPAIHLPLGQSSDNAHLSNERIKIVNLMKGKDVLKCFFSSIPKSFSSPSSASPSPSHTVNEL